MASLQKTMKLLVRGEGGLRPLREMGVQEILALSDLAASFPHAALDVLFHAWMELVDRRRSRMDVRQQLTRRFEAVGTLPAPWMGAAFEAVRRLERRTTGRHHVYVLACSGHGEGRRGLGLYAGQSRYTSERRFGEHLSGLREKRAARDFRLDRVGGRRVPLGLLPSFHAHLNPLSRAEADVLEVALVQALLSAGVPKALVGGPRVLKTSSAQDEAGAADAS